MNFPSNLNCDGKIVSEMGPCSSEDISIPPVRPYTYLMGCSPFMCGCPISMGWWDAVDEINFVRWCSHGVNTSFCGSIVYMQYELQISPTLRKWMSCTSSKQVNWQLRFAAQTLINVKIWMDSFHISHKCLLTWEGASSMITFGLDLYLQAMTLQ